MPPQCFDVVLDASATDKIAAWKRKKLHGAHRHQLDLEHVDEVESNMWMVRGYIFSEIESLMVPIQDRVLATKNKIQNILH